MVLGKRRLIVKLIDDNIIHCTATIKKIKSDE